MVALTELPGLLRDDPALSEVRGRTRAVLAVPEPARALTIAGLAATSARHPILAAVPTTADAERLAHDLVHLPRPRPRSRPSRPGRPCPFERVSPGVETMGRRLRTMWRLRDPERAPRVVVASVRALLQRLGPHVEDTEPLVIAKGERRDRDDIVAWLTDAGYRREEQVEHRGEVAVRGSIVDVFPSTADAPVRIDLWGDEVDRLTEFSVADQRSTTDLPEIELFGCRELLPTDDVRARAAALVGAQPWGREQWERLAEGLVFDGMESWMPWLVEGEKLLTDLIAEDGQVLLIEPRRMRDRAGDILAEEADLATHLARTTWDVPDGVDIPHLHLAFDRLLAHTDAPAWTVTVTPDSPEVTTVQSIGWNPAVGDGAALVTPARRS